MLRRRPTYLQLASSGELSTHIGMQVAADHRIEQRVARQRQVESREIERCMDRMLSQVAAKEHMIDYEVRLVSAFP